MSLFKLPKAANSKFRVSNQKHEVQNKSALHVKSLQLATKEYMLRGTTGTCRT
jgi:hypothetical protein